MLYHFHEFQHIALSPYRAWLKASRAAMTPFQHTPYGRPMAAGLEMAERLTRRYGKPEFGIRHVKVKDKPVRVREEVVDETAFCDLLHFKKDSVSGQPKVLMAAPMQTTSGLVRRAAVRFASMQIAMSGKP